MWQERMGEGPPRVLFGLARRGGRESVLHKRRGGTYVLAAGPEFRLLGVNRLNAPTLASPAGVDGLWYFRTAEHLLCVGRKS